MTRRFALGVASLLALAPTACDAPAAPDAGIDAGRRDAAAADAGHDASVSGECEGTPAMCTSLDQAHCSMVEGCRMTHCFPMDCGRIRSRTECEANAGCTWTGVTCNGSPGACETHDEEDACVAEAGCTWQPVGQCRGTARPCETRPASICEDQLGCTLPRDAGPDASVPVPTCDPSGERPPGCVAPAGPPIFTGCNPDEGVECDGDWTGTNPSTGLPFCDPACAETECCAPADGRFQCVPRDAEGACPGSDIFVDETHITGRYYIEERYFDPSDCAIVEGCVNGSGMRRLLRFDTYTPNVGGADLYLGAVPPAGMGSDVYEWSGCHAHHHFRSYAEYELLSADGCCVAVTGRKQAFCLIDLGRYSTDMGSDTGVYTCSYQGIQRGWQDIYSAGLDCQWIDVTGVPAGDYLLRIRLNTEHVLLESSYDNNEAVVPVTIP